MQYTLPWRSLNPLCLLTWLAVLSAGCASPVTEPVRQPEAAQRLTLQSPDIDRLPVLLHENLQPAANSGEVCGEKNELKYSQFSPAPALVLSRLMSKELIQSGNEQLVGPWLAGKRPSLTEFLVITGNRCPGKFSPRDYSDLLPINPLAVVFSAAMDRLAHEVSADRSAFVEVQFSISIGELKISEGYRIDPLGRSVEVIVEPTLGYFAESAAKQLAELASAKQ